jgi:hypothetical protein
MQEPDFWTASAETMALTIEGNRLIAREMADMLRRLWRRVGLALAVMMHSEHRHLPPI